MVAVQGGSLARVTTDHPAFFAVAPNAALLPCYLVCNALFGFRMWPGGAEQAQTCVSAIISAEIVKQHVERRVWGRRKSQIRDAGTRASSGLLPATIGER